jgi:hypothetical protein
MIDGILVQSRLAYGMTIAFTSLVIHLNLAYNPFK